MEERKLRSACDRRPGWRRLDGTVRKELNILIGAGAVLLAALALLVWMILDTLVGTGQEAVSREVLEANVQALAELERRPLPDLSGPEETDAPPSEETPAKRVWTEEELAAERERIMEMENPEISTLNQWFEGCAIVGDSIAESADGFGFLNHSILFGRIGASAAGAGEQIEAMTAVRPRTVFLVFGLNDMNSYGSHVELFEGHYRDMVAEIREALPEAELYAAAVLPVEQSAVDKDPSLSNRELYNETLQALCRELDMTYLDAGFILEREPSFYEPDGIHAVKGFYYKWLTFFADMAGISQ